MSHTLTIPIPISFINADDRSWGRRVVSRLVMTPAFWLFQKWEFHFLRSQFERALQKKQPSNMREMGLLATQLYESYQRAVQEAAPQVASFWERRVIQDMDNFNADLLWYIECFDDLLDPEPILIAMKNRLTETVVNGN